jgi:hypothetical protein
VGLTQSTGVLSQMAEQVEHSNNKVQHNTGLRPKKLHIENVGRLLLLTIAQDKTATVNKNNRSDHYRRKQ